MPFPSPGDLPNPGIEPRSPALQADSLPTEPQRKPPTIRLHSSKKKKKRIILDVAEHQGENVEIFIRQVRELEFYLFNHWFSFK